MLLKNISSGSQTNSERLQSTLQDKTFFLKDKLNNARVQKRKNNVNEVKTEPPKKALKKNEIMAEFKTLKEKFENLQEENRILKDNQMNNIEAINLLEETISVLENKLTSSNRGKDLMNISVQTEIIRCEECEFPAEDMHDLVNHMHGAHPLENDGMIVGRSFKFRVT